MPSLKSVFLSFIASLLLFITFSSVQTVDPNGVGADLYFAQAVSKGQIPYRDFNDTYGPLMHYANGAFMFLGGHDIHSLLAGKIIFKTISMVFFFLTAYRLMPTIPSLITCLGLIAFTPDFSYNIKSYAVINVEIMCLWSIVSYFFTSQRAYIISGFCFAVILGAIKLNHGISILLATFVSFILCDLYKFKRPVVKTILSYLGFSILTLAAISLFYYLHLKDLDSNEIQQCLPSTFDFTNWSSSIWQGLVGLVKKSMIGLRSNLINMTFATLLLAAVLRLALDFISQCSCLPKLNIFWKDRILVVIILLVGILASNNEYYLFQSDDKSLYARPFVVMLICYLISEACLISGVLVQRIVFILSSALLIINLYTQIKQLQSYKDFDHFFSSQGMRIAVANDPHDLRTMIQTTDYINQHIPAPVPFFTFPDVAIYYYLSNHLSPSRLVLLDGALNIKTYQEIKLINELERKGNKYMVIDNVCYCGISFWGVFGQNNCVLLYKYMKKYYKQVAEFGNQPNSNIGTRIYKRIDSPTITVKSANDLN